MSKNALLKYSILIIVIGSFFAISRCSRGNDELENGVFNIYLVYDSTLNDLQFDQLPIRGIKLPKNPAATAEDIDTYKIFQGISSLPMSHSIIFKSEMKERFGSENCHFVVVVNGLRMYKGAYWANFMDTMGPDVMIYPYRDDEFHITSIEEGTAKINDSRIIDALIEAGIGVVYVNL